MPSPVHHAHQDSAGHATPWVNYAFFTMCVLVVVIAFVGWDQWEDARRDYAAKQRELQIKNDRNLRLQNEARNTYEFLEKHINDPEFRQRIARERTGGAAPGEIILRWGSGTTAPTPATTPPTEAGRPAANRPNH